MSMDKINGSPLIRSPLVDKFTRAGEQANTRQSGEASDGAERPSGGTPVDRAEISEAARGLMELRQTVDVGRAALEALPDIRQDKVDQARERIASGYYESVVVRDDVAAKLGTILTDMDSL